MTIEASLSTTIRASINVFGYKLLPGSCDDDLRFRLVISSGASYRAQIVTHGDTRVATLAVFLTDTPPYHVSYKKAVFELADRMSEVVVFGGISTQVASGAVVFKNAFDAAPTVLSIESVSRWLNQTAFPLAVFGRAYDKVLNGTAPYPALQAALIEENASDRKVVSKATRQALMGIWKGDNDIEKNVRILCDEFERARPVTLKLLND